jgi:hypothetical protein
MPGYWFRIFGPYVSRLLPGIFHSKCNAQDNVEHHAFYMSTLLQVILKNCWRAPCHGADPITFRLRTHQPEIAPSRDLRLMIQMATESTAPGNHEQF